MSSKVWISGAVVDAAAAQVSIFDRGFLYGDSVYEVLRTFDGRPLGLEEHLERLERSAARIEMQIPSRAEIRAALEATCKAAGDPNVYIRVIVTRGAGELGLDPALADKPHLIILVRPVHLPPPEAYENGVEVAVVGRSRSIPGGPATTDPQVKSGNYLGSVLAVAEARRRGAFEAILGDAVGRITEGSSSNIFIVQGGRIMTPPLSAGLLEGITRRFVMTIARESGIAVDERPLWPVDLQRSDEAFITSSVRGIVPVVRVDGLSIGGGKPGAITRRVMELYERRARQG